MVTQAVEMALTALHKTRLICGEERWKKLQTLLLDRERDWHPGVLVPLGLAQEFVLPEGDLRERINRGQVRNSDLNQISAANLMAADVASLLPWELTKGVYLFDPDLFDSLVDAPLERLPIELLTRLPEYSPLILFPRLWMGAVGAWVHLDEDYRTDPPHLEFRINLLAKQGQRMPLLLDLKAPTLDGCIEATQTETLLIQQMAGLSIPASFPPEAFETIRGLLNLALYLASEEPDLSARPRQLPEVRRGRKGGKARIYPDPKPQPIEVGWRIGAALRQARQEGAHAETGTGRSLQPHIRRAHWHLYWTGEGSRKDPSKAQPRIRWIEPTLVGAERLEGELPAVVRPVKQQR